MALKGVDLSNSSSKNNENLYYTIIIYHLRFDDNYELLDINL